MKRNNRIVVIAMALLIAGLLMLRCGFIITKVDHRCTKESCKVCLEIENTVVKLLDYNYMIFKVSSLLFVVVIGNLYRQHSRYPWFTKDTLITLKVELLN